MRNWILSIAASWVYPWIISVIAGYLRQNKALVAAMLKYRSGGTFLDIARSYADMTPEITDDQIVAGVQQLAHDLTILPFNELVEKNSVLAMLGQVKIPDFDSDADNDVTVADELGAIVDKVING